MRVYPRVLLTFVARGRLRWSVTTFPSSLKTATRSPVAKHMDKRMIFLGTSWDIFDGNNGILMSIDVIEVIQCMGFNVLSPSNWRLTFENFGACYHNGIMAKFNR